MQKYVFILVLAFSYTFATTYAQPTLIDVGLLGEMSKEEVQVFFEDYDYEVENGISMFKIRYLTSVPWSVDLDTASGLLVLPDSYNGDSPIVAYQHGTTSGPDQCPSRMNAGHIEPMAYGAAGFISTAADYIGLGDSKGFHPYVHAETEATAGLDMLIGSLEYIESTIEEDWLGELFVAGYSQGGHASMALHQFLEENFSFIWPVKKAAHMSGPYDISGVMRDLILRDSIYLYVGFVPYVVMGYQEAYGTLYDSLPQVFKSPYLDYIESFYNHETNLAQMTTQLIIALTGLTGASVPRRMFRDSIITQVESDPDHPINTALEDNNTYEWAPDAPTRLYFCRSDEVVPFQNSIVADEMMNMLGAEDLKAVDIDTDAGHGDCAPQALLESIFFFKDMPTASRDLPLANDEALNVYPNPAYDRLNITLETGSYQNLEVQIFHSGGQLVSHVDASGTSQLHIDIGDLAPGLYTVLVNDGKQIRVKKLVIL